MRNVYTGPESTVETAAARRGRSGLASALRFATEIIAWVAAPWALSRYSWVLAALSVVVLIGLPAVFATPGDRPGAPVVAVPGYATIALVMLQMIAAALCAWLVWPLPAAVAVWTSALVSIAAEQPRWRWLVAGAGPMRTSSSPAVSPSAVRARCGASAAEPRRRTGYPS